MLPALVILLLGPAPAASFQFYTRHLPNGGRCTLFGRAWPAIGHEVPESLVPNAPRNEFGRAFAHSGYAWTEELCRADSDGDGLSNGAELGDPDCVWRKGLADPALDRMQGHPGVNEKEGPVDTAYKGVHLLAASGSKTGVSAVDQWHAYFDLLPKPEKHYITALLDDRVLFVFINILIPILVVFVLLWQTRASSSSSSSSSSSKAKGTRIWAPGVVAMWLILYSGIAIGTHRLFSHRSFEPTRLLKCVMGLIGTMCGQGSVVYWASLHRLHHFGCEHPELDPHSPDTDRGFWLAHGGFTWDGHNTVAFAADLVADADLMWLHGYTPHLFLLMPIVAALIYSAKQFWGLAAAELEGWTDDKLPDLSRGLPASPVGGITGTFRNVLSAWPALSPFQRRAVHAFLEGLTKLVMYYYLPLLLTWHNSMLINSGVHRWGYETYEDAMSAPCNSKNLLLLFPFMLGEQNHNNHHAAPSSISTWQRWSELDVWPVVVGALQSVGLVRSRQTFRASRAYPISAEHGVIRGRKDMLADAGASLGLLDGSSGAGALLHVLLLVAVGVATVKWYQHNKQKGSLVPRVERMVMGAMLLQALTALYFVLADPSLVDAASTAPWWLQVGGEWVDALPLLGRSASVTAPLTAIIAVPMALLSLALMLVLSVAFAMLVLSVAFLPFGVACALSTVPASIFSSSGSAKEQKAV